MSFAWSARRATRTRTFVAHSFYHLLQAANLVIDVIMHILERLRTKREDDEGEVLHSKACRGKSLSKLRVIHPTGKVFDIVLTGDHGAVSLRDVVDDKQD